MMLILRSILDPARSTDLFGVFSPSLGHYIAVYAVYIHGILYVYKNIDRIHY